MISKEVGKIVHLTHEAYTWEYVISAWTVQRQNMERDLRLFMENPDLAKDRSVALKEAYRMADEIEKENKPDSDPVAPTS